VHFPYDLVSSSQGFLLGLLTFEVKFGIQTRCVSSECKLEIGAWSELGTELLGM
jgi:hypothetical protein